MKYIAKACLADDIEILRRQFIDSLPYPIELHVEWLAKNGIAYLLTDSGKKTLGYFIVSDRQLIEFYLLPYYITQKIEIFTYVLGTKNIEAIVVQSFDGLLLSCCMELNYSHSITGILFREFYDTVFKPNNAFKKRFATTADFDILAKHEDDLYETTEELQFMLENRNIILYYLDNLLAGCGYLIHVRPDKQWYDIGMWTNTICRKQGVATSIISDLKHYCLSHDLTPICGCAVDNMASRKTLERNGFVSKHHLLHFKVI